MKQLILVFFISMLCCVKMQADKIPNDLLNTPVAIVFYEFYYDDDRDAILEDIKERLIEEGVNVVSARNVSNEYEAKIAMADLREKNVKYVFKLLSKMPAFYLNVFPFKEIEDENFRKVEKSCFIEEGANSLDKIIKKFKEEIEKSSKKQEFINDAVYDIALVDTVLISESDKIYIDNMLNSRNILSEGFYNEKGIPTNISGSKIAFVKFQKMTPLKPASASNMLVLNSLRKLDLKIEIFECYEDYEKRKEEFDYRIIFTDDKVTQSRYVYYFDPKMSYKNGVKYSSTTLVALCLRDEKTNYIYQCTRPLYLSAVVKEFRKTLEN